MNINGHRETSNLFDNGKRTKNQGVSWTQPSVAIILKNEMYTGKFRQVFAGKQYRIDVPPFITRKKLQLIQERIKQSFTRSKSFDAENDLANLREQQGCVAV